MGRQAGAFWAIPPAMSGFLSGPHAAFVWGAYAVAVIVLAGLVALSLLARRRVRRELAERGLDRKR